MKLEEAIRIAIRYESQILSLYRTLTDSTQDPTGKRVATVLAKEEQEHLDYLKDKLKEWQESGRVTPTQLRSALPSGEIIRKSIEKMQPVANEHALDQELEALNQALEVEKETSSFYRQVVSERDPEGQALFGPFVEIEEGHQAIVQAEIDHIRGLGFWLDFQEFDLESG